MMEKHASGRSQRKGFTLIELLVVVSIIALLISILLPSLQAARAQARSVVCGTNLKQVGTAVTLYLNESRDTFPVSYCYPYDDNGNWDPENQDVGKPFGYMHWSYFLYEGGKVSDNSFTCPDIEEGGHARTNPGPDSAAWNSDYGQIDDSGANKPKSSSIQDKQAIRMAYTANAAVMPRNKFTHDVSKGVRTNRFVRTTDVLGSRNVILAAEFHKSFGVICDTTSSSFKSKSHRSINPFNTLDGEGVNEYQLRLGGDPNPFLYPSQQDLAGGKPSSEWRYGLKPENEIPEGAITDTSLNKINVIGRHHPGGDDLGGGSNFLYVDGSVARKAVRETMRNREWGDKYYSLNGGNGVKRD